MALTVTPVYKWAQGSKFVSIVQVTGDTSYPNTGGTVGYPITPATFGLNTYEATSDVSQAVPAVPYFNFGGIVASGAGGFTKIDGTSGNLRFFGSSGTEIANTATAAAISATLMAYGH